MFAFEPADRPFECSLPFGHQGLHLSEKLALRHIGETPRWGKDQAYYAAVWDERGYKVLMEYPVPGNVRWDPAQPG